MRRNRPGDKDNPNRHPGRPPHPSLGTRVPPTVIEAGATVGHYAIVYSSATIHSNATIGDRCTLHPYSVVRSGAFLRDIQRAGYGLRSLSLSRIVKQRSTVETEII